VDHEPITKLFEGPTSRGHLIVGALHAGGPIKTSTLPERPFVCGIILSDPEWRDTWLEVQNISGS